MAQTTLVDRQIEDGELLLSRLRGTEIEVTDDLKPAFWAKDSESGQWSFYLITPLVGDNKAIREAYRRIGPGIDELRRLGSSLEIEVIGPTDPIAKDIQSRLGGTFGWEGRLGELYVDDSYIYPSMEELVERLCYGAISLGFTLIGRDNPIWMQRLGPRYPDRPHALDDLHLALKPVEKRLGIPRGLLPEERIARLQLTGGPSWRKEAIEKLIKAEQLVLKNDPKSDSEANNFLVDQVLETFRQKLPRDILLEQVLEARKTRPIEGAA